MTDPTSVAAAFTSIKTALEIAKLIRAGDATLERAELKLKLAELIGALADAKVEMANVQESLSAKDTQLREMEAALEARKSPIRQHDAMYQLGSDGKAVGDPYCLRCWEADHRIRGLTESPLNHLMHSCSACNAVYRKDMSRRIHAPAQSL